MELAGRRIPGWILLFVANGLAWILAGALTREQNLMGVIIGLGFLAATAWLFVLKIKWFWVLSVVGGAFMVLSGIVWLFDDDFETGWAATLVARGGTELLILISKPAQRWVGARREAAPDTDVEERPAQVGGGDGAS